MSFAGGILVVVVFFIGCFFFLFMFAHRLGVSDQTKPDMFWIIFRFALIAAAIFAVLLFFKLSN
jgi:hypothetical protein